MFLLLWMWGSAIAAQERQAEPPATAVQPAAAAQPEAAPAAGGSLPLKPRSQSAANELRPPTAATSSLATLAGSLAVVLCLFFLVAWLLRKGMPKGSRLLPADVIEVLGRAPLAGRQQMHLVRCGNKLLLINVNGGGAETLTEITEPEEVDRIAGLCRAAHPQSATASFRQVFQQLGRETPRSDYVSLAGQKGVSKTRIASTEDADV